MELTNEHVKELSQGSEAWLRDKVKDEEVDKYLTAMGKVATASSNANVTNVTGSVLCVVFYWRIALDTPDGHSYRGNAGGIGSIGGGAIQNGVLIPHTDVNNLYKNAEGFQFNSAAVGVNVNFFDKNSNFLGAFVGGGIGICMGTGGGSGSWS